MQLSTDIFFGSFRLDFVNQCLWRGRRRLLLRPKTFAVLDLLVKHAGQLVTREELLDAVWPDTYVSDGVLRFCIRDLRKTLQDTAQSPVFIETVHRRGYRFVASLRCQSDTQQSAFSKGKSKALPRAGRAAEKARHFSGQERIIRNAHQETIDHLTNGLALLRALPHSPERAQQELAFHLALGAPMTATKGHASEEVRQIYTRARELCRQAGETPQLFPVLYGLTVNAIVRGELQLAHEVSERVIELARVLDDPTCLVGAYIVQGALRLWLGEVAAGNAYLEDGLKLCDMQSHETHTFLYGYDPRVICRVLTSKAAWLLGNTDQAWLRSQEALSLAQASSHAYNLAFALNWTVMLHLLRREARAACEYAEEAIALSHEHGFAHLNAVVTVLHGRALAELEEPGKGAVVIAQGLEVCRMTGAMLLRPYGLALLADAYGKQGEIAQGLVVVEEALAMVRNTGEHWYEAELYRLKGELTLHQASVQTEQKMKAKNRKSIAPNT